MDSSVLIALVVVVGIIFVVWMLRSRITLFSARGSIDKREGEVKLEAAPPQSPIAVHSEPKYSVDINGNTTIGDTQIGVSRPDVRISRNRLFGKSKIQVVDEEKRKRR